MSRAGWRPGNVGLCLLFGLLGVALAGPVPARAQMARGGGRYGWYGQRRAYWVRVAWQKGGRGGGRRAGPPPRRLGAPPQRFMEQLRKLPPQERERVLENNRRFQQLPPDQQQLMRSRLQQLQELSPEQRELIKQRFTIFSNLTPEQQEKARQIYENTWSKLSPDRRRVLMQEFRRLRAMTPAEREQRFSSQDFQSRYNPQEQQLLKQLNSL